MLIHAHIVESMLRATPGWNMARSTRDAKLDTSSARLKLLHRVNPHWSSLEPSYALGYYRPKRRHEPGTWIARYLHDETRTQRRHKIGPADDFVEADGKNILNFSQALAKAREWFKQARADANGERLQLGPLTVRDAWEDYIEAAARRGMKALDRTRSAAELHILPTLGAVQVDKLTKRRIEKWHHALSESPARVRSKFGAKEPATRPAPKTDDEIRARRDTANRVLTILKALLNHARKAGLTHVNADAWGEAEAFKKTTKARIRFLNADESQRLVNSCPPDFRRLVQGALFSGARFGELTKLEARDFDPESGTLHIDSSISKSGTKRDVVLTDEGQAFFQEVTGALKGNAPIFTREAFPDMRRVRPRSQEPMPKVSRAWKRGDQSRFMIAACEAAGLEPLSFHELRHTHASALVNAGVPLAFIAKQLGHANTVMTEKHYGHLAPSAMAEAIRKLAPKLGIHTPGKVAGLKIKRD